MQLILEEFYGAIRNQIQILSRPLAVMTTAQRVRSSTSSDRLQNFYHGLALTPFLVLSLLIHSCYF